MALKLEKRLIDAWPVAGWRDVHVVVAVSGGPDSVALVRAIHAIHRRTKGAGQLAIAHFNHGLRGKAADSDQAWVETLGRQLELGVQSGRGEITSQTQDVGDGWEAAARTARYEFFRQKAERLGARYVATGHTADDQVETVLHRILRGTGLSGLAGIPPARALSLTVTVVRPLLEVSRGEVLDYLREIGQDYCTDETNFEPDFTRNRVRNDLLPKLRTDYNPAVDQVLLRLAAQAGEVQEAIAGLVAELTDRSLMPATSANQVVLRIATLGEASPYLVREVFRTVWQRADWPLGQMGFDQWQQLAALVFDGPAHSAITLPGNIRAERRGDFVKLSR